MLYPKQNASRLLMSLNGVWSFRLGGTAPTTPIDAETPPQLDPARPLPNPEPVSVPASYNDQKDSPAYRDHYGFAYYQRTVTLPAFCAGQRVVLHFGSVTHHARVWLDGELLTRHKGGFLPFEIDITGRLAPGASALLTVECDNRIGSCTLPVGNDPGQTAFFGSDNAGIPAVELGKRMAAPHNIPNFDFFNYAGIHRPVTLYTTPACYIRDVALVPALDGTVQYTVETAGGREPVKIEIFDAENTLVAAAEGAAGTLKVEQPHLWNPWPGEPYLYTARVTCGQDRYDQSFGIRTVEVRGTSFLINGKPFYFKGTAKHEDSIIHGRGFDECVLVKDINLLHWLHANSVRTSHYPYAEEFYDLCDREGIVVIDETPAVGIGGGESRNPYKTFDIRAHHEQVITDYIARDKNHPCVVMWSLGNEPDLEHFPQDAYDYWHSLYELAHSLDPQNRPCTVVCCQNDYTRDITTRTMDVVCLNRYYGWYNLPGDLDAACLAWNAELDFWAEQGKPVMFTEYGADTVEGLHQVVPGMFSEEFQREYYRRINAEIDKRPFFVGEQVWNFADFATIQGPMRVGGNRKGILTRDRRPKLAAHDLRDRWGNLDKFGEK